MNRLVVAAAYRFVVVSALTTVIVGTLLHTAWAGEEDDRICLVANGTTVVCVDYRSESQ